MAPFLYVLAVCRVSLVAGIIRALRPDDYVCSTYRDHVHALSKGVPAREVSSTQQE
jgi:TPP-dependent pyruvate/acetoin dehydrogenase alpha subunit